MATGGMDPNQALLLASLEKEEKRKSTLEGKKSVGTSGTRSWKDNLLGAHFRGVAFKVLSADTSIGRRNVLHQYPFKDLPYLEDLGRDADEYRIEGYVIQTIENNFDYFRQRDALMDALKAPGPGTLGHPFLGEITVGLVGKARIMESFREGGIARFSMIFVLAGESTYPTITPDYKEDIDQAVEKSTDLTKDGFGTNWITESVAGHVWTDLKDNVQSGMDMIRGTLRTITDAGASAVSYADSIVGTYRGALTIGVVADAANMLDSVIGTFNGYKSLAGLYGNIGLREVVGKFSDRVRGLVFGPVEQETAVVGMVNKDMGKSTVLACLEIARYGDPPGIPSPSIYSTGIIPVIITTSTKARMSLNQRLIINLFRNLAIITAIQIAIRVPYDSADEAIKIMEAIVRALDSQLLRLGEEYYNEYHRFVLEMNNNDFFEAMQSLRPIFVKAMIGIGANLAKVIEYRVRGVESSLALVYNQYEDLDREAGFIDGNRPTVKHPGFLPGGVVLEVLSE